MNPNIHIYSEEIQKNVEDKMRKIFNRTVQEQEKNEPWVKKGDQGRVIEYSLLGKRPVQDQNIYKFEIGQKHGEGKEVEMEDGRLFHTQKVEEEDKNDEMDSNGES
mmetsp:Transcript_16158/g.15544  ORF Transcript_16158/g.15544 Transcript_16158/m.15544 type:complete len:106 (+) Transcript_16158:452-769(+)|eukprot:CAMPEP_0170547152 /NCGR_PEP_ID=MMETSP0211-20121228/5493_1 /TAXON_ID=311385 /ORGANISM="Pseudokeronopsis sp., Strain OXSARD2" /LENGTH=105 /DNA_ID=CAMNT_0010851995 /DNA_START=397 /DNA_END=714 /DNA_ORIENTATION=+